MPYAPELGAAFLYGEGVHGFVLPNGHYTDDLWAYDANGHRWICLYPGSDTKNLKLKMDANGFESDADGQPIPVAQMGHAFEQVTYDTDRKKLVFMPCAVSHHRPALGKLRDTWGTYPWPYTPVNCSPWMYSPATGKFELYKTQGPFPAGHVEAVVATYSPSTKKLFHWRGGQDVWFYDAQANAWTKLTPKGPKLPFGCDPSACLDTKRDRIYIGGGYYPFVPKGSNALWGFDLKTNAWVDLQPKGQPCKGCNRYGNNQAVMNYDAVNDVVVLFYHLLPQAETDGPSPGPEALGVYVYDPATNSWSEDPLPFPKELVRGCFNAFYSPELNAHFIHIAGDSADNGVMWAYRYKRAAK
jgi:hypothetical protein